MTTFPAMKLYLLVCFLLTLSACDEIGSDGEMAENSTDDNVVSDSDDGTIVDICTCDGYPEAERCHGGGATVTHHNEYEVDQLANCKCYESESLNVGTKFAERIEIPNMELICGNLTFDNNYVLSAISMPKLKKVQGAFSLSHNPALTTLSFPSLVDVGALKVDNNVHLVSLDGINALESVRSTPLSQYSIEIIDNWALENIDGLSNVAAIQGSAMIADNDLLASVSGLLNVVTFTVEDEKKGLTIMNNPSLPTCDAVAARASLNPQNCPVCIKNNLEDTCLEDNSGCY